MTICATLLSCPRATCTHNIRPCDNKSWRPIGSLPLAFDHATLWFMPLGVTLKPHVGNAALLATIHQAFPQNVFSKCQCPALPSGIELFLVSNKLDTIATHQEYYTYRTLP